MFHKFVYDFISFCFFICFWLFLYLKRKRAFRWALGKIYRRAASFCRFLVRRFVVLPFRRFVVRRVVLVSFVSICRPVVLSFVASVFCRFVVSSLRCVVVGKIYRRAASFCRFFVRRFVVLSFRRSVVRVVVVLSFRRWVAPQIDQKSAKIHQKLIQNLPHYGKRDPKSIPNR